MMSWVLKMFSSATGLRGGPRSTYLLTADQISGTPARARKTSSRFIPEIEGLRGVAAMTVVVSHSTLPAVMPQSGPFQKTLDWILDDIVFNGAVAVGIFFTISGYSLAVQVKDMRPSFRSWIRFVGRRFFRLVPLLVFALAVCYVEAWSRGVVYDA
jgi:peptidoglycan/LPS O-acetylase OafA/YrhL